MTILLAPDKFRGSLTARQVCEAMSEGIRLANPGNHIVALPLADGGEGTAQCLTDATNGTWHTATVSDPLGRAIQAGFGLSGDKTTAFIELAQASGLTLLADGERNPLKTNTFGAGQLIRAALDMGVRQVVLGIGGSATTDAGTGMAAALGWRFLDVTGQPFVPTGETLIHISQVLPPETNAFRDAVGESVRIDIACDVANSLFGPNGAASVYGPQKGATPNAVNQLDAGLRHVARLVREQLGLDLADVPGAGAAGGAGFGAMAFLGATLRPGVDLVLDTAGFDAHLANADLVLTGEGKLDEQTIQGKLVNGVCRRAGRGRVPVVAICGTLDLDPAQIQTLGLTAAFSILNRPQSLGEAVAGVYQDVVWATFNAMRLFYKTTTH
jgi:glycerate 2-kinase